MRAGEVFGRGKLVEKFPQANGEEIVERLKAEAKKRQGYESVVAKMPQLNGEKYALKARS